MFAETEADAGYQAHENERYEVRAASEAGHRAGSASWAAHAWQLRRRGASRARKRHARDAQVRDARSPTCSPPAVVHRRLQRRRGAPDRQGLQHLPVRPAALRGGAAAEDAAGGARLAAACPPRAAPQPVPPVELPACRRPACLHDGLLPACPLACFPPPTYSAPCSSTCGSRSSFSHSRLARTPTPAWWPRTCAPSGRWVESDLLGPWAGLRVAPAEGHALSVCSAPLCATSA